MKFGLRTIDQKASSIAASVKKKFGEVTFGQAQFDRVANIQRTILKNFLFKFTNEGSLLNTSLAYLVACRTKVIRS